MAALQKIKRTYYLLYRVSGKQYRKNIGHVSKVIAEKIKRSFEEELALRKAGLYQHNTIELSSFIDEYLEHVQKTQADKTWQLKKGAWKTFQRFLNSNRTKANVIFIMDLNTGLIERFKVFRLGEFVTTRTVNIELNFLSNMIKKAKDWGYLVPDIKIERLPEISKLPRYFTEQELDLMLTNTSNYLRQVLMIGLYTGMRIKEMLNLKWSQIDFNRQIITIQNTDTFKTKSRKERVVPLNSELKNYLLELRDVFIDPKSDNKYPREISQKTYVICAKTGAPIACVRKAFSRFLKKLKISNATLHTLRHTFASHCVMSGVELYAVKHFLGHSRVTTTEIYAHLSQRHQQTAIEKLSLLKNNVILLKTGT
jgi:integrase